MEKSPLSEAELASAREERQEEQEEIEWILRDLRAVGCPPSLIREYQRIVNEDPLRIEETSYRGEATYTKLDSEVWGIFQNHLHYRGIDWSSLKREVELGMRFLAGEDPASMAEIAVELQEYYDDTRRHPQSLSELELALNLKEPTEKERVFKHKSWVIDSLILRGAIRTVLSARWGDRVRRRGPSV